VLKARKKLELSRINSGTCMLNLMNYDININSIPNLNYSTAWKEFSKNKL